MLYFEALNQKQYMLSLILSSLADDTVDVLKEASRVEILARKKTKTSVNLYSLLNLVLSQHFQTKHYALQQMTAISLCIQQQPSHPISH